MSGGSFNYAYSRVQDFADELEYKIDHAGEVRSSYGGWTDTEPDYGEETHAMLRKIVEQARKFAEVMRAVEWMYSGDSGPEYVRAALEKMK